MERTKIKVSILMGVYNPRKGEWLEDAIRSMAGQSLQEWELLLYDDGSDAAGRAQIQRAAAMDQRVRLLRGEENQGLAYALNACLKEAKGEYVARMDDDDLSRPDRLRQQYDFLEHHPEYAFAGTLSELFDETGTWGIGEVPEVPCARDFLSHSPYIHPSVMFRREVLEEAGGYRVGETTRRCEDYELFMRLHESGRQGYNLQRPLLLYREDEGAYRKRKYQSRLREMKVRYEGFRRLGLLKPGAVPYVVKPLAVGLVPGRLQQYLKKRRQKDRRWQEKGNERDERNTAGT